MITEVAGLLSSLKTASDLAQAAVGLRDAEALHVKVREFNDAIIDVQHKALAAQAAQAALVERIGNLEKQIAELETWGREKDRYQLVDADSGRGSVFVYAIKAAAQGSEPLHAICAKCYQNGKKSILQATTIIRTGIRVHECLRCKSEFTFRGLRQP